MLKFVEEEDLSGFSFKWSKVRLPKRFLSPEKPNILNFKTVTKKDMKDYYECEVKEGGKKVITVYRTFHCKEISETSEYIVLHVRLRGYVQVLLRNALQTADSARLCWKGCTFTNSACNISNSFCST